MSDAEIQATPEATEEANKAAEQAFDLANKIIVMCQEYSESAMVVRYALAYATGRICLITGVAAAEIAEDIASSMDDPANDDVKQHKN